MDNSKVNLTLTNDEAYLVLMCLRKLKHDPMFEEDDQDKIIDIIDSLVNYDNGKESV